MKRLRMLVLPAVVLAVGLAVALPAQARAGSFSGVVVAKQRDRGTMLVAGAHGAGEDHAAAPGDRVVGVELAVPLAEAHLRSQRPQRQIGIEADHQAAGRARRLLSLVGAGAGPTAWPVGVRRGPAQGTR